MPVYKWKGVPFVCSSYRAIKLLDQSMNVLGECLKMIICQVSINDMHFGFMPGNGTPDAILIMRHVLERHQARKLKLYHDFVDLENT